MKTVGYIDDNGTYHAGHDNPMPHDVDSQYRSWSHMEQRKRHSRDIIQPYDHGEINREFVQSYDGEVAERYFSKEEISKAERKLS
jgi:hypothetical protein